MIALLLTLDESQKMNAGEQQQATQYYALKFEKSAIIYTHPTLLQAEEKRSRNPVPKCPSKLLEPAIGPLAG